MIIKRVVAYGLITFITITWSILALCLVALFLLAIAVGAIQDMVQCADRQVNRMADFFLNLMAALVDKRGKS
jgi:hypothetical protein